MKKVLLACAVAAFLSGCVATRWGKNGNVNVDSTRDAAECDYQTSAAVAAVVNPFESAFTKHDLMIRCMRARGFELYQVPY